MAFWDILSYLVIWSLIGALLFNLYIIFVFRSGMVYTTRKVDGTLKRRLPLSGIVNSLLFLVLIVGLLLVSNLIGFGEAGESRDFLQLFLLNYGLYWILFLYDAYVIDYFVIGRWRPAILQLPEDMNAESMAEHIRASWQAGPVIGLFLAALSAGLTPVLRGG